MLFLTFATRVHEGENLDVEWGDRKTIGERERWAC